MPSGAKFRDRFPQRPPARQRRLRGDCSAPLGRHGRHPHTGRPQRAAARGGFRAARQSAGGRRRRQRQDPRAGASHRLAGGGGRRAAEQRAGGDVHQQGRRRDARARGTPAGGPGAGDVAGHLPRHRPPPAAHALARRGVAAQLPDLGRRGSAAAGEAGAARTRTRRPEVAAAPSRVVHQPAEGRGPPRQGRAQNRPRRVHHHASENLHRLRAALPARRLGGFRRVAAAQPRALAGAARHLATLSKPLPPSSGGRVPRHQRHSIRLAADVGRRRRTRRQRRRRHGVGGGRRRSSHLRLARREGGEHSPLPERFHQCRRGAAGAELPLLRHHSARRQRPHRAQHGPARQKPVHRCRRRQRHPRVLRLQRLGRSPLRRRPGAKLDRHRRRPHRGGGALPLERAIPGDRGGVPAPAASLSHLRRRALLRTRRGAQCPRLHAPGGNAPRGRGIRSRGEHAAARHRRQDGGNHPRARPRPRRVDVAGMQGGHRGRRVERPRQNRRGGLPAAGGRHRRGCARTGLARHRHAMHRDERPHGVPRQGRRRTRHRPPGEPPGTGACLLAVRARTAAAERRRRRRR